MITVKSSFILSVHCIRNEFVLEAVGQCIGWCWSMEGCGGGYLKKRTSPLKTRNR